MGAIWPILRTLIQTTTPERLVGRVMGSSVTLNRAAQMLPLVFIGGLAAAFGVQRVLVLDGVFLAILAVAGYAEARHVDATAAPVALPEPSDPTIAEPASRGAV